MNTDGCYYLMVLEDGKTFSCLGGCHIVAVPNDVNDAQIEDALRDGKLEVVYSFGDEPVVFKMYDALRERIADVEEERDQLAVACEMACEQLQFAVDHPEEFAKLHAPEPV